MREEDCLPPSSPVKSVDSATFRRVAKFRTKYKFYEFVSKRTDEAGQLGFPVLTGGKEQNKASVTMYDPALSSIHNQRRKMVRVSFRPRKQCLNLEVVDSSED